MTPVEVRASSYHLMQLLSATNLVWEHPLSIMRENHKKQKKLFGYWSSLHALLVVKCFRFCFKSITYRTYL